MIVVYPFVCPFSVQLDVLDQSVSTTAHLSNIQSAFFPKAFARQPVIKLEAPAPEEEYERPWAVEGEPQEYPGEDADEDEDELDPLDKHLAKLLKKQKRKETVRQVMRGIWAFLKTPLGVFFAIYGFLVV